MIISKAIKYTIAKPTYNPVNAKFQLETLNELSFMMFDISPMVALYGPTKKEATAPVNMATVRTYGEIPSTLGFNAPATKDRLTAG